MADDSCVDSIESVESGIFLGVREVRRVYLITYSQADTTKVPSCEKFSDIVLQAFQQREVHNAQCAVEHFFLLLLLLLLLLLFIDNTIHYIAIHTIQIYNS